MKRILQKVAKDTKEYNGGRRALPRRNAKKTGYAAGKSGYVDTRSRRRAQGSASYNNEEMNGAEKRLRLGRDSSPYHVW